MFSIVCGFDLHRGQVTFDVLMLESGEALAGSDLVAGPGPVSSLACRQTSGPRAMAGPWRWRSKAAPAGGIVVEEIGAAGARRPSGRAG